MAWTTPLTALANTALTAAQWNASVRDNLAETAVAKATASGQHFVSTGANAMAARTASTATVATAESTTQTSYGDHLSTIGPSLTVSSGTKIFVAVHARVSNGNTGEAAYAGWRVDGATSLAASDALALAYESSVGSDIIRASAAMVYDAFTSGSQTIKVQYKVSAGTGFFADRKLSAIPF